MTRRSTILALLLLEGLLREAPLPLGDARPDLMYVKTVVSLLG